MLTGIQNDTSKVSQKDSNGSLTNSYMDGWVW